MNSSSPAGSAKRGRGQPRPNALVTPPPGSENGLATQDPRWNPPPFPGSALRHSPMGGGLGAGPAGLGTAIGCDCGKKGERRLVEARDPKHESQGVSCLSTPLET